GVSWYLRKLKIPFLEFVDAVAPALIIAYGVGRIGCQLSGDGDWGITAATQPSWWFLPDWMWAYDYPQNVNNSGVTISGLCDNDCWQQVFGQNMSVEEKCAQCCGVRYCHQLDAPVYPTPFYETIMAFIIGGILWMLRKRLKITGMLFFVYVFFVGIERFFIEKIRVNPDIDLGFAQATQAEIISVIMMLLGIAGCWILWTRAKRRTT
ncbi:MAG TPA: prolipoprotein diacylglyceryl transferase, partial [Saprospiraceae bacterium]|nr:prolipoprotein diacylglyceryl transferase [Saprospiraceae bacterium]